MVGFLVVEVLAAGFVVAVAEDAVLLVAETGALLLDFVVVVVVLLPPVGAFEEEVVFFVAVPVFDVGEAFLPVLLVVLLLTGTGAGGGLSYKRFAHKARLSPC